jgi:outer membrane protein assembly factor BamB
MLVGVLSMEVRMNQTPILSRFFRTMPSGITFILLASHLAGAADAPVWNYRSPSKIVYVEVTPLGSLAVTTAAGLTVLDPASGVPQWSRSDVRGLDVIEDTPFGVARLANGAEIVQLETGKTKWRFADAGVNGIGGFVALPKSGLLILVDFSGQVPALVGADLETGTVRWKQQAAVNAAVVTKAGKSFDLSPYHTPLQDTDSTIVIYPSHGGPVRLHLGSGQILWRAQGWGERGGSDLSFIGVPPPQIVRDGDLLFFPYDRRLLALDANDGHIVWDHAEKFQSEVVQMETCAQGLFVRGEGKPFLRMLDRASGREVWVVPFKKLAPVGPFVIRGENAYAAGEKTVAEITLATGDTRNLAAFKFEGKELPFVELSDTGLLLASSQNLCALDSTGAERYHLYLKAPGASFLGKLASTTLIMAFNVASVGYAGPSASVITNNPILSMRFHASVNARNFAYIFTGEPDNAGRKGFSLVRVDKRTGVETGRLWMDNRSPDFRLDAISGTAYVVRDDLEISALRY